MNRRTFLKHLPIAVALPFLPAIPALPEPPKASKLAFSPSSVALLIREIDKYLSDMPKAAGKIAIANVFDTVEKTRAFVANPPDAMATAQELKADLEDLIAANDRRISILCKQIEEDLYSYEQHKRTTKTNG